VSEEAQGVRLDRVEAEVQTITNDMGTLKTDMSGLRAGMKGLGDVLQRIEANVSTAQQQWQDDKHASRINPVALATVLVSVISILVGGAWVIGGQLARQDERGVYQQRMLDRVEQRQWASRIGGDRGVASAQNP
jgi:hypothetical protein